MNYQDELDKNISFDPQTGLYTARYGEWEITLATQDEARQMVQRLITKYDISMDKQ